MNSLGGANKSAIATLKRYLVHEARNRQGAMIDIADIGGINARVPIQPNTCDCGMYVLENVERFFAEPEKYLRHILASLCLPAPLKQRDDPASIRERWYQAADIRRKRKELTKLVCDLEEEYVKLGLSERHKPPTKAGSAGGGSDTGDRAGSTKPESVDADAGAGAGSDKDNGAATPGERGSADGAGMDEDDDIMIVEQS
nr:hypothetical protein HK105_006660 [Polyrhizophydium stewartii]